MKIIQVFEMPSFEKGLNITFGSTGKTSVFQCPCGASVELAESKTIRDGDITRRYGRGIKVICHHHREHSNHKGVCTSCGKEYDFDEGSMFKDNLTLY